METQSFPVFLYVLLPLLALGLQSFLTLHFAQFALLDLPLLVTIYFAISSRNAIAGTLTGSLIGLCQDALTHHPIGVNGISKAIVGYLSGSLGLRIDTENHVTRVLLILVFAFMNSFMYLLIMHRLLGLELKWSWIHELIRAVADALIGVALFAILDHVKLKA